ncbi:MAG: NAD(P)/FAD-dependent oxidoreductase [Myxococcota bacterium]
MAVDVDVVVIGSGAGGMSAAVALARAGKRVQVVEQHTLPGGWCHSFDLDGYSFSPGVHYLGELGPGGRLREVYEGLGLGADLAFYELDPNGYDQIHVGDGFRFDVPRGREAYCERLAARFPSDAAGIQRLFGLFHSIGREIGRFASDEGASIEWFRRPPDLFRHGLRPLQKVVDEHLTDPLAKAVVLAVAGDHGMPPERCPTALHAAVAAHYFEGAWYPKGGARALPKAFIKELRRNGGEIRVGAKVEQILVERGRAIGVRLAGGDEIRATDVVSNADPTVTAGLLPQGTVPWRWRLRLPRTRYSSSSMSLFMASDLDPRRHGITSGNVWLISGLDADPFGFAADPDPLRRTDVPAVFLTCTTSKDPTKRRDKIATFEAFTFVSWDAFGAFDGTDGARPPAYDALKEALADRMLDVIERRIPGFRASLVFRSVGTPLTNRHYVAGTRGSMYGTEKAWYNIGPMAFGPKSPVPGLWMAGASALAHGVAGATHSGVGVAKELLRCKTSDLLGSPGAPVTLLQAEPSEARVAAGG